MIGDIRFAYPYLLGLLVLIPLLEIVTARVKVLRQPPTVRFADVSLVKTGRRSWRITLRPLLKLMRLLALAFLIMAAARPQSGESRQIVTGEGVDIALALDISGSMASLDFEPDNRLVAAKGVIADFVEERPFDRVGLVVFAREAFAQSPLTVDHEVLKRLLQQVELAPSLGLDDGTAIGMGLATAANMLKDSSAESRVIILLTDGVNNSGQIDPFTAAQAAATLGIRVYTIGAGKPGQVPFPSTNIFGDTVVTYQESIIDEETLRVISAETGGKFYRAQDTATLRQIYEEINQLEQSSVEIQVFSRFNELGMYAIIPALLLLGAEIFLRHTVFRTIP